MADKTITTNTPDDMIAFLKNTLTIERHRTNHQREQILNDMINFIERHRDEP